MANDVRVKRALFMVDHTIDVLGAPATEDANASGVRFDLLLSSGNTRQIDRIDIRNVAVSCGTQAPPTEGVVNFRVNFFHSETRGGIAWTDSTYIGGVDIECVSGVPEHYGAFDPASGIYYGNCDVRGYAAGVVCYLPYYDFDHEASINSNNTHYIHCTMQNIGNERADNIKIIVLYELANPIYDP